MAGSCNWAVSSSAPLVPRPRACHACSTKGHAEEDLKGEGCGRRGLGPEPLGQAPKGLGGRLGSRPPFKGGQVV